MTLGNFSLKLYVQKTTFRNMFVLSVWVVCFFLSGGKSVEKDRGSKIVVL